MSSLFDILSAASIVGIWPRYIEPRLVKLTHLKWDLPDHFSHLRGRRFALISDLHLNPSVPQSFLNRVVRRILRQKPDVIFFVGDFLCHANLGDKERLKSFLNRLQAPYGSYCVLGNHDYSRYVSCDPMGTFAIRPRPNPLTGFFRGVQTIFNPPLTKHCFDPSAQNLPPHEELVALLRDTPFTLLENATVTLPIGLNITGLGEHALSRNRPETAFSGYQRDLPGIVLTHNPDSIPNLLRYPGEWIFAGHTHGEQIHLPSFLRPLSRKLTRIIHTDYTRGHLVRGNKQLYITRGIGSPKPFRVLSPPEIVIMEAS